MIANQLEGIINITFIINYIEIMNIYKILYQDFTEGKSITFDFFNKYQTYSFKIIFYQNNYYLFLRTNIFYYFLSFLEIKKTRERT